MLGMIDRTTKNAEIFCILDKRNIEFILRKCSDFIGVNITTLI